MYYLALFLTFAPPAALLIWFCFCTHEADWHRKVATPKNHLRDRSGFITPELLQAILGIGLMIALALVMASGFADEPRW
ncbi:hypothetical protein [Prosthecobacter sp.]|jgi:hypothetical protein|uniref:hypothetical protein n=1 Tax=Prosthecobacter sp. TaxID=1965333 RepID=UPI0037C6B3EA